jgi:hypothetical protein
MNTSVSIDDQRLLTRAGVAAALTDAGFPISPSTLATLATRGNGPPFRRFGIRVLYPWLSTLEWARGRLGPPTANTSADRKREGLHHA